jgi:peptidoglycan/LPS O-acetylase OafA/YrhL
MNQRNQSLDVLRGVAILLVLGRHMKGIPLLSSFGAIGVDLFFVLSGFLISGLLFAEFKRTGTIDVKRFWIRRGFKIYPSFYALIAATIAVSLLMTHSMPAYITGDILFLQGYRPHVWAHGWSLAIEEHFYLVLPLLLFFLVKARRTSNPFRLLPAISILISMVCLYMRVRTASVVSDWGWVLMPTHLRIDSLFAGVALGYFAAFDSESFSKAKSPLLPIAGLFMIAPGLLVPGIFPVGLMFIYVGFSCIVAWSANRSLSSSLILKAVAWVGVYSYSIYLWGALAVIGFDRITPHWWKAPAYFVFAIGVGVLMSKLIEQPALRLRDRIFPSLINSQSRNHSSPVSGDKSAFEQIAVPAHERNERLLQPAK